MRLLIVSARPGLETNRRLVEAADALGFAAEVVDATRVAVMMGGPGSDLLIDGRSILDPEPAGALVRVGNWRPETMMAVVETLEARGISTPNGSVAFRTGRDHWRTLAALARAGLPVPRTLASMDPEGAATQARTVLGFPVVVKLRRSRMGVGAIRCLQIDHLESVLDSLWRIGDEFILQEWVDCGGRSTRHVVCNGTVVAAVTFQASEGEWRSNGARGGSAHPAETAVRDRDLARDAAETLGLGLCGVDLLHGPDGPVVCEVNPTPGFKFLERAGGTDVATAMIRSIPGLPEPRSITP